MKLSKSIILLLVSIMLLKCNSNDETESESEPHVTTPVTVTSIENTSISEKIGMNAVSVFQKKNQVKSNINGYIEKSFVNIGDFVQTGKLLFTLKTKEAAALNNFSKTDSSILFKGEMNIVAHTSGIVTEVPKLVGDYVADGEQLCVIADISSFVFVLNVPFEYNKFVSTGNNCNLLLPDSTLIPGIIATKLSTVDAVAQTQSFVLRPQTNKILPENLLAIVQITKSTRQNAQVVDKNCVLTDETMENFWVMKLINDTTAVRVTIEKGISNETKIEIISPKFDKNDKLISMGSYGLPDTAFVKIIEK